MGSPPAFDNAQGHPSPVMQCGITTSFATHHRGAIVVWSRIETTMTAARRKNWMTPLKLLLVLLLYIQDAALYGWFGDLPLLFGRLPMQSCACEFFFRPMAPELRGLLEVRVDLVAAYPRVLDILQCNSCDMIRYHRSAQ